MSVPSGTSESILTFTNTAPPTMRAMENSQMAPPLRYFEPSGKVVAVHQQVIALADEGGEVLSGHDALVGDLDDGVEHAGDPFCSYV